MENNNERKFSYYSRIVILIILSIEFILNITCIAIIGEVKDSTKKLDEKDIFKEHYKSISAIFALFFINFAIFLLVFIINCTCQKSDCSQPFDFLFIDLNHFITLITFFICQFLYLIQCIIIPVYLQRVKNIINKNYYYYSLDKIKHEAIKKYTSLTVVIYVFLFIILFLNFIVMNLYREICCKMESICKLTENCCENFGRWFLDKLSCFFCQDEKEENIKVLERQGAERENEIDNLTGDIRNLMADNLELNVQSLEKAYEIKNNL